MTPRVFGLMALLALGFAAPGVVRADGYQETEVRLKSAGLDPAFREAIHTAIRDGVTWLRHQQRSDGSFRPSAGDTALAGLALRHAATPEGIEGGQSAIRWLAQAGRKKALEQTYTAGLTAMLLTADRSEESLNRKIHDRLARGPARSRGYWDYDSPGGARNANLSTAQFACLGLWAGERSGARIATRAWKLHLDALLKAQTPCGSWSYGPGAPDATSAYPNGTFMGLADLILARHALGEDLTKSPTSWARVLVALGKGKAALRRHLSWTLARHTEGASTGTWALYRLFALEKACLFLDLEEVGGFAWYREGTRILLAAQQTDGSFTLSKPQPDVSVLPTSLRRATPRQTSFALLFLLRVPSSYHPSAPRPVDGSPTVTPSSTPPGPARGSGEPQPARSRADQVLDHLEALVRAEHVPSLRDGLEAIDFIRRAHASYRRDGSSWSEAHDAWCLRAEALLLEVATHSASSDSRDRVLWQALAFEALDALAETDPRIGRELMRLVEELPPDAGLPGELLLGWYGAVLDALRRLEVPGLAAWASRRLLVADPSYAWRTSAALTLLAGSPGLEGHERRAAAQAVMERLEGLHGRDVGHARERGLMIDCVASFLHVSKPEWSNDFPSLDLDHPDVALEQLRAWWEAHKGAEDPQWRN